MFLCNISGCSKVFRYSSSFSRHKKQHHPEAQKELVRKRYRSRCLECQFVASTIANLRKHLEKEHGKKFPIVKREFDTSQEFLIWKSSVESVLRSCFIEKRPAVQTGKDGYFWKYYYCNRSGRLPRLVEDSERKRAKRDSSKMGHYCTATITTKTTSDSGRVLVEACLDHYGHQLDDTHLKTLRIPKLEREELMEKVREGGSLKGILEDIRAQGPVFHSSPRKLFPEAPGVAVPENIPPPLLGVVSKTYLQNLRSSCRKRRWKKELNYDLESGQQIRSTQLMASKRKVKQIWLRTIASLDSLGEDSLESLQKALGLFLRGAELICPRTMVDSPKSPEPVARKKQGNASVGSVAQKRKRSVEWPVPVKKEREEHRETFWASNGTGKTTPRHLVVVSSLAEVHSYANS